MLKEVSSDIEVNNRGYTLVHLMYLPDTSHLLSPEVDRYSQIIKMCRLFHLNLHQIKHI